jgi:hypothetical protein
MFLARRGGQLWWTSIGKQLRWLDDRLAHIKKQRDG